MVNGDNIRIGEHCVIEDDVKIGNNVRIGHFVYLASGTIIEDDVFLDSYVCSSGKNVRICRGANLRYGCIIARGVIIGERVFLAPRVTTLYDDTNPKTIIGEDVFVGAGAIIAGGVTIAPKTMIGAGSFVKKDCPGMSFGGQFWLPCLYAGIPAKMKRTLHANLMARP